MTNLPLYLDIPQPKFQDSDTSSASFISGRRHHAVSLSLLCRCDEGVVPIMSPGISFIEQSPQSDVCSPHTAVHFSLGDSISRYTHHASSAVSVPPFQRAATPGPTCVSSPSPAVFLSASQDEITQPPLVKQFYINQCSCNLLKPTSL